MMELTCSPANKSSQPEQMKPQAFDGLKVHTGCVPDFTCHIHTKLPHTDSLYLSGTVHKQNTITFTLKHPITILPFIIPSGGTVV